MKNVLHVFLIAMFIATGGLINAQTVLETSFEDYTSDATIDGQGNWELDGGNADVLDSTDYAKDGNVGVKLGTSSVGEFQLSYVAFDKLTEGPKEYVYFDSYIKVIDHTDNGYFQITGNDLTPSSSSPRHFMIELYKTTEATGKYRVYNGGSKIDIDNYTVGEWMRVSVALDYTSLKYQVAFNGVLYPDSLDFRESYDATSKGRATDVKEFHQIRWRYSSDDSADVALDSVYIGTTPIADIPFTLVAPIAIQQWSANLTQTTGGTIEVSPTPGPYNDGTSLTFTATPDAGYMFSSWTGISGSTTSETINISSDLEVSATFIPVYSIDLTQSTGGTISVDPDAGPYYEGQSITFTATPDAGYMFSSWTGISGSTTSETIDISSDLEVSATFIPVYSIDLTQSTGGTISVDPDAGPYYEGQSITFTATPDAGYSFESWTGISGTTTSETITLSSNLTINATFSANVTSINKTASNNSLSAYPNPFEGSTTIAVNGVATIEIYSISGKLVDYFEISETTEWLAPKAGVYFGVINQNNQVSTIKLFAK